MDRPTGFWQSIAAPRLGEKVPRGTWKEFLSQPRRPEAGGDENQVNQDIDKSARIPDSDYPEGQPLSEMEHRASRNHRPESLVGGEFLCRGFSIHAGCRFPSDSFPRGKREIIKTNGLHFLTQTQLARRGGHLTGKKIQPRDVDGHVQALRLQLIAKDLDIAPHIGGWGRKGGR